ADGGVADGTGCFADGGAAARASASRTAPSANNHGAGVFIRPLLGAQRGSGAGGGCRRTAWGRALQSRWYTFIFAGQRGPVKDNKGSILLPLYRRRRLAADVVDDAVDA